MDFIHPGLLAGGLLAALPIVLHLMMRQKPKHIEFPALRFVQAKQTSNRRTRPLAAWPCGMRRAHLPGEPVQPDRPSATP